jgi:hypothetical protein
MADIVSKSEVASILGGKWAIIITVTSNEVHGRKKKRQKSGLLSFPGGVGSSHRKVY